MQEKLYKKRIKDIDELRARILTAWDEMDQGIIDAAIRQWRTRLARGAGDMAPKPPWLTQNFAQWRQDRTWLT